MTTRIYPYRVTQTDQRGDALLVQTQDDGDLIISAAGAVQMTGGLETAAYLALFGGNQQDDGTPEGAGQWWANALETDTGKKYRSRTQYLLASLTPSSENLKRIQAAVEYDLGGLVSQGAASSVKAAVSMPAAGRVGIDGVISAPVGDTVFSFLENWGAMFEELEGVDVGTPVPQEIGDFWIDDRARRYVDYSGRQFQFRSA